MIRHRKTTLGRASDRVSVAIGLFGLLCGCGASAPEDTGVGGKAGTHEANGWSAATRSSGSSEVEGHFDVATPTGALCEDGECSGMNISAIKAKLPIGVACTVNAQCASGFCVDGLCCDSSCHGTCRACTASKKGSGLDGTCGPIAAQTDPDDECGAGACNGSGVCSQGAGEACISGIQCASRICNNQICDPPRNYSGPLQWLTIPPGYQDPTEIAALNNGQGVAVVGYWSSDFLQGTFASDGVPNLGHFGVPSNPFGSGAYLHVARGGVIAYYEMTNLYCSGPGFPCQYSYSCNTSSPAGVDSPLRYIVGQNDAGQSAGIAANSWAYCAPTGYGPPQPGDLLQRASSAGMQEISIAVPAGLQLPIILGPAGEFHWGPGTNLTKTDVSGSLVWTKTPTISGSIASSGWDVDASGNILIAVSFSGTIDYGAGRMSATGSQDLGLIKLDPEGDVLWQKHFGNAGFTSSNVNVSRTGTDDFTVSGDHTGTIDFGTGVLVGGKFVVKFASSGTALWHVDIMSANVLWVVGDLSGAVYVGVPKFNAGNYNNTNFGWGLLNEFFIAKYQ